ncbi:MAG: DUF488 family protein [Parcubacteria group bacterium]
MLQVYTAIVGYPGGDRLDVSLKTGDRVFAPSRDMAREAKAGLLDWDGYVKAYLQHMRLSYKSNRPIWDLVLASPRVVLCCYCADPLRCHRSILAGIFVKLGARSCGEITEWDDTIESPIYKREQGQ